MIISDVGKTCTVHLNLESGDFVGPGRPDPFPDFQPQVVGDMRLEWFTREGVTHPLANPLGVKSGNSFGCGSKNTPKTH